MQERYPLASRTRGAWHVRTITLPFLFNLGRICIGLAVLSAVLLVRIIMTPVGP